MPSARQADDRLAALARLHAELRDCRRCPAMQGPAVHGETRLSPVMLIGQAPGTREIVQARPFCWTAGKTLFNWFAGIGLDEPAFRRLVLMSAVCRCFPGKNPRGGDRVPDRDEVRRCEFWWRGELALSRPRLIVPVGKLAIARFLDNPRLQETVGQAWSGRFGADGVMIPAGAPGAADPETWEADILPLPHPSGASTWFKMEPGRTLLRAALDRIAAHPAWRALAAGRD